MGLAGGNMLSFWNSFWACGFEANGEMLAGCEIKKIKYYQYFDNEREIAGNGEFGCCAV
jgi:hypothetical protein